MSKKAGTIHPCASARAQAKRAGAGRAPEADPTLVATAAGRPRLFLFSRREPDDSGEAATGRCARLLGGPCRLLPRPDRVADCNPPSPPGASLHELWPCDAAASLAACLGEYGLLAMCGGEEQTWRT